jgi:hypothetical protein
MFYVYKNLGHGKVLLDQSEAARFIRCQFAGRCRAAYWRALGFPNLVRARERLAQIRAGRRRDQERQQVQERAGLRAFLESTRDDL